MSSFPTVVTFTSETTRDPRLVALSRLYISLINDTITKGADLMSPLSTIVAFASEGARDGRFGALSRLSSALVSSEGRKKGTYHVASFTTIVAGTSATTNTGYLLINTVP
jgi:hypothetical protein